MKKTLAIIFSALVILSVSACTPKKGDVTETTDSKTQTTTSAQQKEDNEKDVTAGTDAQGNPITTSKKDSETPNESNNSADTGTAKPSQGAQSSNSTTPSQQGSTEEIPDDGTIESFLKINKKAVSDYCDSLEVTEGDMTVVTTIAADGNNLIIQSIYYNITEEYETYMNETAVKSRTAWYYLTAAQKAEELKKYPSDMFKGTILEKMPTPSSITSVAYDETGRLICSIEQAQ